MSDRNPKELGQYAREWARERLRPFALQTAEENYWDADSSDRIRLNQHGLTTMLDCEAHVTVPEDFPGWSVFFATRQVAIRSLRRYLDDPAVASVQRAVRVTMSDFIREAEPESTFVDGWLKEQPPAVRVLLAARAAGWVASLVETVRDADDEAEALIAPPETKSRMQFKFPDRALMIEARVDALYGKRRPKGPSAETSLVVVTAAAFVEEILAFEGMATTVATGIAPGFIAAVIPKSGEVVKVAVDTALIERGLQLSERLADLELRAVDGRGATDVKRTASFFGCRSCALAETCPTHLAAADEPVVFGGLQPLPVPPS